MRHTDSPAITDEEVNLGFIRAAHWRVRDMKEAKTFLLDPPTLEDFSEAMREKAVAYRLLGENWRNRIYRVVLKSARAVVAKQLVVATDGMLHYQYGQHAELTRLHIPGLHVPEALALLPDKRLYFMEFAHGKTLDVILRDRGDNLLRASQLAGEVLAQMHSARMERMAPVPIEALARDFNAAPWHLRSKERRVIDAVLDILASAQMPIGPLYYDYKPANVLFRENELQLIDPPDTRRIGLYLWDFALFRSSMRRHLWRFTLRRPHDNRQKSRIRSAIDAFESAYRDQVTGVEPPHLFALAAWLFELQRNGLLTTMQRGKIDVTKRNQKDDLTNALGSSLMNYVSLSLLAIERKWLIAQLGRELKNV